jgi:DNA-binding GntR family transcriptional regulator
MIFDQKLKAGQKLVQEKLAEELGVSRSPLLKALQKLESDLLVENIPRRGIYVKSMSVKEIVDVFLCRSVLEGLSARLAATLVSAEQIKELKSLFSPFYRDRKIDAEKYAEADRNFHSQIMKWSGNAVIHRLEVLSHIQLKAYQAGLLRPAEETLAEHFAIIDALEKKDGPLAEQLMRRHIERSMENLMRGNL